MPIPAPSQDSRLLPAGVPRRRRAAVPRRRRAAGQQPGQVAKQLRRDLEHGTIGDQVESWG